MIRLISVALVLFCATALIRAQTADELVAKNLQAKGGVEKIKAIKTLRSHGKFDDGTIQAAIGSESMRPDKLRRLFTVQGMTEIDAYDGKTGWKISPFQGKKDAESMGEDDLRGLMEDADFDGPLVDATAKGNKIEYQGKQQVDGDDAYVLKVTLKNGDVATYYLDPDTFLEFRVDRTMFIRGDVRETTVELGSYKPVNGYLFAFSFQVGPKAHPENRVKIILDSMEANVPLGDSRFAMPAAKPIQEHPAQPGAMQ